MVEYRLALPQEEADILDFINYVFSQAHKPHNFKTLLPKVYAHEGFYRYHYVAVDNGRIRGVVAVLPVEMPLGDETLKIGYVGSVSVHPYDRGAGHMKKLMNMMLDDAQQKYDLLVLGGRRQRYQYFGFERGGTKLNFTVTDINVQHAMKEVPDDRLNLRLIEKNDDPVLGDLHALCAAQVMNCVRDRAQFLDIMHNWQGSLYALEENGETAGYIYAKGGNAVAEMGLRDESRVSEAIKTYLAATGEKSVSVRVDPLNRIRANYLKSFSEKWDMTDNEMLHVISWQRVLQALLNVKTDFVPLMDGCFVFAVENAGCYAIEVKDHRAMVCETQEEPQAQFTATKAVEFFFSPYTSLMVTSPQLKSWLPVPFGMSSPDEF